MVNKNKQFIRRKKSVRGKIHGTLARPRLSVYKSNKYIYAQLINDDEAKVLASVSSIKLKDNKKKLTELAFDIGEEIAKKAKEKKIKYAVFDKSGYKYHGAVQQLADGARKGGLEF